MIFGQETLGWAFRKGEYYDWPFPDIFNLYDFLNHGKNVEAYVEAYRIFDFCKHQPINYRSPFWRMYRALTNKAENGIPRTVIWNNLFKVDYNGHSPINSKLSVDELEAIINISRTLISREIEFFAPNVCLFFTGPNYDFVLKKTFEGLQPRNETEFSERYFCRLASAVLPVKSYRTYHPAYLNRIGKFDEVIEIIGELLNSK